MTHEEARKEALSIAKDFYLVSINDFERTMLAYHSAYIKARSAILCQSTPTCWTNLENLETPNLKPRMATKKHPDHVERSTFNIPLHQPLKD